MARYTSGCQSRVDVVEVAGGAGHGDVETGQGEGGLGMIEEGPSPGNCRMAQRTVGRESGAGVIRVGRSRVISLVTTVAVGGDRGEVTPNVTEVAGHGDVEPGQGELCPAVIERGRLPSGGGVAEGAGGGEAQQGVIGIGGGVEILEVAGEAVGGGVGEAPADVAGG